MTHQVQTITQRWQTMTLAEQLGNVGSDFERAVRWKIKGQQSLFTDALARTLTQLDLTLTDARLASHRRREVARVREEVCRELLSPEIDVTSAQSLNSYFLAMATLARAQ